MSLALAVIAHRIEDLNVLHRARVSRASAATLLAGFSAIGWCLLRRAAGRDHNWIFSDAPMEVTVVEDGRRVRAGNRARQCARATGMLLGRMLLGQTDEFALGCAFHRTGPRGHGRADRCEVASDATLRIIRDAHRLFLSTLVAQAKEIQRPGDSGLRADLRDRAFSDRIRARRSPRRYFRLDHADRTLNLANDRNRRWRRSFDYTRDP